MSEAKIVLPALTSAQLMICGGAGLGGGIAGLRLVVGAGGPGGRPRPKSMTDVADAIEGRDGVPRTAGQDDVCSSSSSSSRCSSCIATCIGLGLPLGIALAFLMGVSASYGAGFVGMWLAVKGNVRSANAALTSFKDAMELAFKAGGVSGMFTVGLGLLGATIIFLVFQQDAMKVLVGFGFGGSLAALFMRVGGGIFTKAADVGGDLVGKIEAGSPEDDPRNAATIADNVGDNVGDCAGMAADVFESYEVTLVAAIILAAYALQDRSLWRPTAQYAGAFAMKLIIFALILRGGRRVLLDPRHHGGEGAGGHRDARSDAADQRRLLHLGVRLGDRLLHRQLLLHDDPRTGAPDWRFAWCATLGIVLPS